MYYALQVYVCWEGEDPPAASKVICRVTNRHNNQHWNFPMLSPRTDPMAFPLLFWRGEEGWDNRIPYVDQGRNLHRQFVTLLEYYRYRLSWRKNRTNSNNVMDSGRLSQLFFIAAWLKIEGCRQVLH